MATKNNQRKSNRATLNEVLAAELGRLRPDLKDKITALPYNSDADETPPADNLRDIYQIIGKLSEPRPRAQPTPSAQSAPSVQPITSAPSASSPLSGPSGPPAAGPLSALCLSGGGIRSATFNLGVLQSLARIGLLGKFDYLSSVSGGGYIASWLRAWMHRTSVTQVVTELSRRTKGSNPLATEPKPVTNLREYSNYLTPAVGLFSGDTWSAAATIARNLLLNWLMLVPLLGAGVGIPLLSVLFMRTSGIPGAWPSSLLVVAIGIEIVASVLVYRARRFAKKPGTPQAYFVLRCVLPICLAAGVLSTAGVGLNLPWAAEYPEPTSGDLYRLWGFAVIWSIAVPILGWSIAELLARFAPRAKVRTTGKNGNVTLSPDQINEQSRQVSLKVELFALIVSGLVGASLLAGSVTWWFSFLYNHPALYAILVLPLLLGMYLLSRVVFVGCTSLNDERGDRETRHQHSGGRTQVRSRISSDDSDREWWSRLSGWVLLVIVCWVAVMGVCLVGCYLPNFIYSLFRLTKADHVLVDHIVNWIVGLVGAVSGLIAALASSGAQTSYTTDTPARQTPPAVRRVLAIAGPLFVICLIMVLSWAVMALGAVILDNPEVLRLHLNRAGNEQPIPWQFTAEFVGLLLALIALAIVASRIVNVNRFSLHGMYRNRLVRAYLGASNCTGQGEHKRTPDPFTGFALSDNLPLHELCAPSGKRGCDTHAATSAAQPEAAEPEAATPTAVPEVKVERPISIINTTLNLVNGQNLAWQQRKAESFSMTPLYCGSWREGYRRSTEYGGPGGVTVGTAVTISGAAANPNMGYSSSPVLGFLMAIFNVRLGAWLGNTNPKGDSTYTHPGPRNAIMPMFAEMFGLTNSQRGYVNLSDGGHFDNLGLYEVVLRRCRHVFVSDAGQDGSFTFEDLGNAIRKIRIDFGINIVFEKIQILPNTPEREGLCCAIARIRYSDVDETPPEHDGLLIYVKPTLRGRGAQVPYDIYSYSRESDAFPHESTADQWFSESQFESYRVLGSHIVEQLLTDDLVNATDADFTSLYESVSRYMNGDTYTTEPPACTTEPPAPADLVPPVTVSNAA
jgi:hypothetical protein